MAHFLSARRDEALTNARRLVPTGHPLVFVPPAHLGSAADVHFRCSLASGQLLRELRDGYRRLRDAGKSSD